MPTKFSQFLVGGNNVAGDIDVGLRSHLNYQFNAPAGSGGSTLTTITQNNHGFVVNNIVYYNGTMYALALADNAQDAEVIGIVVMVIDVNTFVICTNGRITTLSGATPGAVYFLSDAVAGLLTTTAPITIGHIEKPLVIADGSSTGFFFNWRGKVVPSPGGFSSWTVVTTNTAMMANMGYITNSGSTLNMTLPVTANIGDTFRITALGAGGWTIVQNTGQLCSLGTRDSTLGSTGSVSSTQIGDSIELVCVSTNSIFQAVSSVGNLTFV